MGELLTAPELVVDQVTSLLSNDFAIHSADGRRIGRGRTTGSLLSRMVAGHRRLTVEEQDGSDFVHVHDVMGIGRDRFRLTGPDGRELGTVVKRLSVVGLNLDIDAADGPLTVQGSLFERQFTLDRPDRQVAQVSRTWKGVGQALLGRNRYVLAFGPAATADDRRLALGVTVAVDLIRAKRQNG